MKFRIHRASLNEGKPSELAFQEKDNKWYIEINSLDDLEKLNREVDDALIINFLEDPKKLLNPDIWIYDDYME